MLMIDVEIQREANNAYVDDVLESVQHGREIHGAVCTGDDMRGGVVILTFTNGDFVSFRTTHPRLFVDIIEERLS